MSILTGILESLLIFALSVYWTESLVMTNDGKYGHYGLAVSFC